MFLQIYYASVGWWMLGVRWWWRAFLGVKWWVLGGDGVLSWVMGVGC